MGKKNNWTTRDPIQHTAKSRVVTPVSIKGQSKLAVVSTYGTTPAYKERQEDAEPHKFSVSRRQQLHFHNNNNNKSSSNKQKPW